MNTDVSVNFIIEGTKPNKNNEFPIKLNIYNKEAGQKRYGIKEYVTKENWDKLNGTKLRDTELKNLKAKLNVLASKASNVASKINPFSFIAFEEAFFAKSTSGEKSTNLKYWFDKYIKTLKENGQVGSAISYQTTINSILQFKRNLTLHDITPAFLQSYENHLLSDNKSISTVGIYMRQLRAIINQAISDKILSADKYPFKKYKIPAGRNVKKALSFEELTKLLNHKPADKNQQKALDFWIFSYLCNGMNFTDIAHLRPENIHGSYLNYLRQKTKRTKKKDLRPIKVALNKRALEIIQQYRNHGSDSEFLFPILEPGLKPITIKHRCQRLIKWVNNHMEEVRQELGIEQKLGTYSARHSFSTVLKRKGASTSFIKEALGHSSEVTTENYLDSFTDDVKMEYANLLTQL